MKELNEKLFKFAGFYQSEDKSCSIEWVSPDGRVLLLPKNYFTESLDACFKWLVPKDYQQIIFQPDGYCGLTVNDKLYENNEPQSPALSLCRAIEKLIEQEPNEL